MGASERDGFYDYFPEQQSTIASENSQKEAGGTNDHSMSVISISSRAQIQMSVPKIYYFSSDTLKLVIKVTCLADKPILVPDPNFFKPVHSVMDNEIGVSVRAGHSPEYMLTSDKLIMLNKLESASYFLSMPLDFYCENTYPNIYYIKAWIRYTPYKKELEYMTQGVDKYVDIRSEDHNTYLELYTMRPSFGDIAIVIISDWKNER